MGLYGWCLNVLRVVLLIGFFKFVIYNVNVGIGINVKYGGKFKGCFVVLCFCM